MTHRTAPALIVLPALLAATLATAAPHGPPPQPPPDLPTDLAQVHLTLAEISWDFGDVEPFDWRKELTSSDPTATFKLRWRYTGPGLEQASLAVADDAGTPLGEVPLPLGPVFADGFRYNDVTIGNLPGPPTLELRVLIKDSTGAALGSPSNAVQISAESPPDPFLYTPLFILGVQQDTGVPGIAGSIYCEETDELRTWTAGVRRYSGGVGPIASTDRWHIGSNTKAFTCTLLALLIQNNTPLPGAGGGTLDWDTPIASVFPEWSGSIKPRFLATTIRHLACHRSGLRIRDDENDETRATGPGTLNEIPTQGRREMAKRLLDREHTEDDGTGTQVTTVPGEKFFYGSGNYLILGAVIDQLTGGSYETVMQTMLLAPLGITTAGFGMPTDISTLQPHGHYRKQRFSFAFEDDNTPLEPVWNAAGGLYLSQADWLRFCRLHLNGSEGSMALTFATRTELHTPHPRQFPAQSPSDDDPRYAWGWGLYFDPWWSDNRVLTHEGTYFRFYARHSVHLDEGFAVVSAANSGPGRSYGDRAIWILHPHLIEKTKAKIDGAETTAGFFLAGSGGSTGVVHPPEDDRAFFFDHRIPSPDPDPDPFFTLGGAFLLNPLRQNDEFNRALAVYFRAPQLLSFTRIDDDRSALRFTSEAGLLYNLYRSADGTDWNFDQRIAADDEETEVTVHQEPDLSTELFQIREVLP